MPVELRIGIVGHRWLEDDDVTRGAVAAAVDDLWQRRSNSATANTSVGLTVVSALAEGADRIAAAAAVDRGARLEVVLPLPSADYEKDFQTPESLARYRELLADAASVTALPIRDDRDAAYLEGGMRVVERCDAVIAIWDGEPARGTGGTAEIVAYADAIGRPVRWLRVEPAAGIIGIRERREHPVPDDLGPLSPRAFRALDAYNSQSVRPADAAAGPEDARFFQPYFARADRLAGRYQRWLLRSSQLIYALAVVAVASVAGQLVFFPQERWPAWIEVAALAIITIVLFLGRRLQLLRRWLSARQLAERIRVATVLRSAGMPDPPRWGPVLDDGDWVERAVEELWMRAPDGPVDRSFAQLQNALVTGWLDPQIAYHDSAEARAQSRLRVVVPITVGLFVLSLAAAIMHSLDLFVFEGMPAYWSYVSIIAPTAAAAVSGYVGQREYVRRARRSRQAADTLRAARSSVDRAANPAQLHAVLAAMQPVLAAESQDWSTTTTMHDLEVP
ncbi:hypothetical protein [Microbacterium rhizosphaerae]|uniref:SMODS and SLOG-associating 2TM effector domain-containing protein n=1 Tax=Microbacterium rhizosphaerae TaxID=1678237 RepID=A0ABZ0SJF5_9MICO|nr:hypothetical protein [Microbacterium rhizosphaerae]WPR89019.1 hypothetical protein SM116_14820 [Microbacterium rhizosphaerae]